MTTGVGSLVPKGNNEVMAPPAPRAPKPKREQIVLDEDEWIDKIEAIIQRDYFPDLPKLESEVEWLEAVRTKDPELTRQAQANIRKRRAGLKTPIGHTPATFATPAVNSTPNVGSTPGEARQQQDGQVEQSEAAAPAMSLDRFMASHTSEDNASFDEILEGINKRRRLKHAWLHRDGEKEETKQLEDKRPLDGYGTTGQTSGALLDWPYVPDNSLFYRRDAVPFTDKELALQVQGPPKQISAANTRMPTTSEEADLTAAKKLERGDEYERIATPSFIPGPDAPPPMTWGRLDATPARVEDDSAGPHFRVLERKPKDLLAHRLADGARLNLQKRAALLSPSVLHGIGRKTPRVRSRLLGTPQLHAAGKVKMSPAAHRLATSLRGSKGGSADVALRASYRPGSSVMRTAAGATPAASHPPETPAILRGETPVRAPALKPAASVEDDAVRAAALQAFDPSAARNHALDAFGPTAARQDALKAFGKITDNLLHI